MQEMSKTSLSASAETSTLILLFAVVGAIFCGFSHAGDMPRPGNRYKIIGPVYLTGVYSNLNDRKLSWADLSPVQYSGPEVAFQRAVPTGTIMSIVGPTQKVMPLPFFANRYVVRLEPTDIPPQIRIIMELNRGIEGSLDGLNPELFSRQSD